MENNKEEVQGFKLYQGTKKVYAHTITLGDFKSKYNRDPYKGYADKHSDDEEGYLVKYSDSYVSWSPKRVFEDAYKLAETPLNRMIIEGSELTTKLNALDNFMSTEKFCNLDDSVKAMLITQGNIMSKYHDVLNQRYVQMEHPEKRLIYSCFAFSEAIDLLRVGYAVRRRGWNGKGMYVVKQVPACINENIIPNMQSLPPMAKKLLLGGKTKSISYMNQMLIIDSFGNANSWVPSSSDVFATDWELVLPEANE